MATFLRGERKGRKSRFERTKDGFLFTENRTYVVISDDSRESPVAVAATPGLPIPGISFTSSGAVCRALNPEQDEKQPKVWYVDAEFTTEPLNQRVDPTGTPDPNPVNWIPIYEGVVETFTEVMMKDQDGKPYVNSAKDKFPEPLLQNRPIIVYEFSQYEPKTITDFDIGNRTYTTNSSAFGPWPKQTLQLIVKKFTRGWFFGYETVKIDYRMAYKEENWLNKPLNMGYSYRATVGGDRVNSPVIVALNTNGTKKADTADPDALEFKAMKEINFNTFLRR